MSYRKAGDVCSKIAELHLLVDHMQRELNFTLAAACDDESSASFDMAYAAQKDAITQAIALLRHGSEKSKKFRVAGYAESWSGGDVF